MNTINLRQEMQHCGNILYPYGKINNSIGDNRRISVARGEGIYLYSNDGEKYLDAISGLWNTPLGYSQEIIKKAIWKQCEQISGCSLFDYTYQQVEENAGKILRLHDPHMSKICYTCSGSEAVDLAIKFVRKLSAVKGYLQKKKIVSFRNSYHGTTYAAMTISGEDERFFSEFGPGLGETMRIPPLFEENRETEEFRGTFLKVFELLETQADEIAGIVIEPILLSMGIQDLSYSFLDELAKLCTQNDICLVFDEVATGFYRLGTPFGYQKYGIHPDVVCMSKAINAGYLPLGAVAISKECENILDDAFQEDFLHGSTQSGNPLAIAASNAALQIYDEIFVDDSVIRRVGCFTEKLNNFLHGNKLVSKVERNGNLVLVGLQDGIKRANFATIVKHRDLLRQQGLLTYPSQSGLLMLPMYITTDDEYDKMAKIIASYFG